LFVRDCIRARLSFHQTQELIKSWAETYNPSIIAVEAVQYQAAAVQELQRTTTLNVVPVTPDKDKITRFQPLETRYEQGLVHHDPELPRYFRDELLAFPNGDHDDLVDAFSSAFSVADTHGGGSGFATAGRLQHEMA
jgi:predicted phage terminase large subunit-like protein